MMRNASALVLIWVLCRTTSANGWPLQSGSIAAMARQEYQNHHYNQSEKLFKTALDSRNIDDITRGAILSDLGTLYLEEERLEEAEQAYISALKIFRRSSHLNETALLLRHLGAVYSLQRRHDDAKRSSERSIEAGEAGCRCESRTAIGDSEQPGC